MNFKEASAIAALNHWEFWNLADEECTEDRCVKGKFCPFCGGLDDDMVDCDGCQYDPKEYTGVEDDDQE